MALDATKWSVAVNGDIRYTGPTHTSAGANWVTVLELHRWLQDLADDASSGGDDYMDITRATPSDKSFDTIINLLAPYNIDDTTAEYIYGGSIIQAGGDTSSVVIYDRSRAAVNTHPVSVAQASSVAIDVADAFVSSRGADASSRASVPIDTARLLASAKHCEVSWLSADEIALLVEVLDA